jgi:biopolymer transport protein ExbD
MPRRRRKRDESEINITPMLDVVFIMLIFFIVTTSFVKEWGIDVTRPSDNATVKSEAENIVIEITAQNTIMVNKRPVDLGGVRPNVERLRAENPEASVIVATAVGSRTGLLVSVIDQARQAGAEDVSIASTGGS